MKTFNADSVPKLIICNKSCSVSDTCVTEGFTNVAKVNAGLFQYFLDMSIP